MKFVLNITFSVLFLAGVCATSQENSVNRLPLSQKEIIRYELQRELRRYSEINVGETCPLPISPEQIVYANEKYAEHIGCANATIEIFLKKLDDDIKFDQIEQQIVKLSGNLCEIFYGLFRCVSQFSPVLDLCLAEHEKIFKDKLLGIIPLIHEAMCSRNGTLIAEILQHEDGLRCIMRTKNAMVNIGLRELFVGESDGLFGEGRVCQRFNEIVNEFYTKFGECSSDLLEKVKDTLRVFCEHTQCEHFVDDLRCH